jgi:predicted ferric reductase
MDESVALGHRIAPAPARRPPALATRLAVRVACLGFFVGNIVTIVWIWVANHNLPLETLGDTMSRLGGLTGLLAAYLALVQVILLARLPWLERLAGFDRLTVWHRWNGFACVILVVAHTLMAIYGYALGNHSSFFQEFWTMVGRGAFPGMVTATIATGLFVVVSLSSLVIVRARLSYELWYVVHLTAYAAIALAWFHEIPVGGDLALSPGAAEYWRFLFFGTIALIGFRLASPLLATLRYRLRVAEVISEGPDVVSLRLSGRRLERMRARPGQFFIWRFLTPGYWWTAHPFSLSAAPDGRSLRISVKASGDHTARMGAMPVGTRVVAEGPFGSFGDGARRNGKALLIAGGIGITPVRALAEVLEGDVVILHRVRSSGDIVFAGELPRLASERGLSLHYVVGDHAAAEGRDLLSPGHLRELVPDLAEREVFLCGPPAMIAVIRTNLLRAGVARRRLHVERFAL